MTTSVLQIVGRARWRRALLAGLAWVVAVPSRAVEPVPAEGARASVAPPAADRVAAGGAATSDRAQLLPSSLPSAKALAIDDLPSTVSPSIARFLKNAKPTETPPALARSAPGAARTEATREALRQAPPASRALDRAVTNEGSDATRPEPGPGSRRAEQAMALATKPVTLPPAPTEPTDQRFPINLATALRLSDARPLVVAAAQASAWVAEAQLTRAKVLWVPTAMFGFVYLRHDGGGPDFNKGIMTAPSVNYFMAGGSADLYVNFTDAIFEPLVARQTLDAAHWNIQTAKNDALLRTADAYFHVHRARGTYAGALYCVERGRVLVGRVANLSKELVPAVEVERARNMLADLEQRATAARQDWRVASADLTQVLRLDPRAVVEPLEHDHAQITLVDPGRTLDDLIPVALSNRPELASRRANVRAAEARVRREKWRPLLPVFTLTGFQHPQMNLQAGVFGIGPNGSLDQYRGRSDVSVQFVWQLESFGAGNLARIKQERGRESDAIVGLRRAQDAAAGEVYRALARVQAGAALVLQADRGLRAGIASFNGQLEGLGQTRRLADVLVLTYRPQEVVYSLEQLNISFNEYFRTVAEYNRAQFELFHALGYPAGEVTALRAPGEVVPVETRRPGYLPPVGNGPPPATR